MIIKDLINIGWINYPNIHNWRIKIFRNFSWNTDVKFLNLSKRIWTIQMNSSI